MEKPQIRQSKKKGMVKSILQRVASRDLTLPAAIPRIKDILGINDTTASLIRKFHANQISIEDALAQFEGALNLQFLGLGGNGGSCDAIQVEERLQQVREKLSQPIFDVDSLVVDIKTVLHIGDRVHVLLLPLLSDNEAAVEGVLKNLSVAFSI